MKARNLLEVAKMWGLVLAVPAAVVAGAVLGIAVAGSVGTAVAFGAVGAYAGGIAGYTAVSQAPMLYAAKTTPLDNVRDAASFPFRMIDKMFDGKISKAFNSKTGKGGQNNSPSNQPPTPKNGPQP